MNEVSKGEGRTILFVSHNMQAVSQICNKGILLVDGHITVNGNAAECVTKYLSNNSSESKIEFSGNENTGDLFSFIKFISVNVDGKNSISAGIEKEIELEIHYINKQPLRVLNLSVSVIDEKGNYAFSSPSNDRSFSLRPHSAGYYIARMVIPGHIFNTGIYYFTVLLVENGRTIICQLDQAVKIEMHANNVDTLGYYGYWGGVLRPSTKWEIVYEDKRC